MVQELCEYYELPPKPPDALLLNSIKVPEGSDQKHNPFKFKPVRNCRTIPPKPPVRRWFPDIAKPPWRMTLSKNWRRKSTNKIGSYGSLGSNGASGKTRRRLQKLSKDRLGLNLKNRPKRETTNPKEKNKKLTKNQWVPTRYDGLDGWTILDSRWRPCQPKRQR